jgi:hypothetical protein
MRVALHFRIKQGRAARTGFERWPNFKDWRLVVAWRLSRTVVTLAFRRRTRSASALGLKSGGVNRTAIFRPSMSRGSLASFSSVSVARLPVACFPVAWFPFSPFSFSPLAITQMSRSHLLAG